MEDEEKGEAKPVEETISEIKRGNEFSNEKVRPSLGDGIFYFSWVACPAGILMTPTIHIHFLISNFRNIYLFMFSLEIQIFYYIFYIS